MNETTLRMPELRFDASSGVPPLELFPGPLVIGRDERCDRTIDHPAVAPRHVRVERTAAGWFISDLGSAGGVEVDGVAARGAPLPLADGSEIRLGSLRARFRDPSVRRAPQRTRRGRTSGGSAPPIAIPDPRQRTVRDWIHVLWTGVGIALCVYGYLLALRLLSTGTAG